jgi:hypothetical protein
MSAPYRTDLLLYTGASRIARSLQFNKGLQKPALSQFKAKPGRFTTAVLALSFGSSSITSGGTGPRRSTSMGYYADRTKASLALTVVGLILYGLYSGLKWLVARF